MKICFNTPNNGRMEMIDLETYIHSTNIKTIYRVIHASDESWNAIAKYWLQKWDRKFKSSYFICTCSETAGLNIDALPVFIEMLFIHGGKC